jgi:hypothetical protein
MRYVVALTFLLIWMALIGMSWGDPPTKGPNPMAKHSTNPTLAEVWQQMNHLSLIRPDLSGQSLIEEAVKRAYILKNGEEI